MLSEKTVKEKDAKSKRKEYKIQGGLVTADDRGVVASFTSLAQSYCLGCSGNNKRIPHPPPTS